jgi:transcriptional regulator with XRE-family HTH domain
VNVPLSKTEPHRAIGRSLAKKRKALRLTQAETALKCGLSLSMLRRAESLGTIPLPQLLRLVDMIGCDLHLREKSLTTIPRQSENNLNKRHPGLVWSNSKAPKEIYLRKALLNPRFGQLLELAREFGLDALKHEWSVLSTQSPAVPDEVEGAAPEVTRILRNMERALPLSR